MKKTTLLLFTTLALAGCYSSPEMTENKYRDFYSDTSVCGTSTMYQHKNLRDCIEKRTAEDEKNKKNVLIQTQKDGKTLLVSKNVKNVCDAKYESVDVREEFEVVKKDCVAENGVPCDAEGKNSLDVQNGPDEYVPFEGEYVDDFVDEAKYGDEYFQNEETAQSDESVEYEEVLIEEDVEEQYANENVSADGVTLVVGPLKEDLVISVKSSTEPKDKTEKKVTRKITKKVHSGSQQLENPEYFEEVYEERDYRPQNFEKEVLPIEEK